MRLSSGSAGRRMAFVASLESAALRLEKPTGARRRSSLRTGVAVAITVLLWASAFVGIRAGLRSYSPGPLALLRYLVASVVVGWYAAFEGSELPPWREWGRLFGAGAIGVALYNLALASGERTLTAGAASFLGNTVPVLSALLAAIVLRERLSWLAWGGI